MDYVLLLVWIWQKSMLLAMTHRMMRLFVIILNWELLTVNFRIGWSRLRKMHSRIAKIWWEMSMDGT